MTENPPFRLETESVGSMPIVNHYLKRLKIEDTLSRYLTSANAQNLEPASCIGVLLRNIITGREPVYNLKEWVERYRPDMLGIDKEQMNLLNDDKIGRALDILFESDRASIQTEIIVRAINEFDLKTDQLHNDSTSVTLTGDYSDAKGENKRGKKSLKIAKGHNKDHRPDLKQLLWIFTATSDGTVPIHYRACDGNTTDSPTHTETWNALSRLLGKMDFLYVADCKLCTSKNLKHIDSNGGRFITVVPRSDGADIWFRRHIQTNKVPWIDIQYELENKNPQLKDLWKIAESPMRSSDGFRVVWVWHQNKEEQDKYTREKLMQDAVWEIEKLDARLRSPRTRFRARKTVVEAADVIINDTVGRWMEYEITEEISEKFRQTRRGRPGSHTDYKRTTKTKYHITWHPRAANIEYDIKSDGMFPMITNCDNLSLQEILDKYKYQPKLEKRHEQLKSVYKIVPMFLKSVVRIEGVLFVFFIAMLVQALIEREIRHKMEDGGVKSLPIYPEDRECSAPTTDKVLGHFDNIEYHRLKSNDTPVQTFLTPLSAKQSNLLTFAGVPLESYTQII